MKFDSAIMVYRKFRDYKIKNINRISPENKQSVNPDENQNKNSKEKKKKNHSNSSPNKSVESEILLYPDFISKFNKTIEIFEAPLEHLKINNLGPVINSSTGEWDPNPTPDGRYLYFTTSGRTDGYGGHDVFVSKFEKGAWQKPFNIGNKINGPNNETIDNISADGNTVLLSGDFEGTLGKFDIYLVSRDEHGWGPLEHLPYPINTIYHDEGACLSSDGKVMVFTSDRPGATGPYVPQGTLYHGTNNGNLDIYVCFKNENGWSTPKNIGTDINTPYSERSPYLHPDGKTLYFSSDGHPGLGRLDVFKTVRLDDTWTHWSEPVNLGKEINTILDDWGYKITVHGDSAFFAAQWRTIGYGDWDLFSVNLPQKAKPEKVITIRGKVTDQNGNPLSADILWEDLTTGKNVGHLKSNPEDGTYIIILPFGKNYGYFADKTGYYPSSENIDLINNTSSLQKNELVKDIKMVTIRDMADKQV